MIKRFIYRRPESGDGGGQPNPGFSLDDLDNEDIPGPDDNKKPESLEGKQPEGGETDEEREARETAEAEAAQKLADEQKKKDEKPAPDDAPKDEDPEDVDDEAETFIAEVKALRGDDLDVDYGDVDPLSPAGVVLRERALEDNAVSTFEAFLEEKYPKAYGYLLHTMAGKPEDEFFGSASNLETLPTVEEIEASVEVSKTIILANLVAKGNSEKHANLIIKQAIEDNELEELAKTALTERTAARDKELDAIKKTNDEALEAKNTAITEMNTYVDQVVATGKVGNIEIPVKDRAAFAKQFKESIRYDNGKFVIVSELTQANIEKAFGKEYFSYKNGDLGSIVKTAAKTENANRLRRTIPVAKTPKGGEQDKSRVVTLGDLEAD